MQRQRFAPPRVYVFALGVLALLLVGLAVYKKDEVKAHIKMLGLGRAQRIASLRSQFFQYVLEPALDGRAGQSFQLSQTPTVDSIPVAEKDHAAK